MQAKEKLAEYLAVLPSTLPASVKPKERWKPPDASLVKINFDGAIFKDENRSSIGVVVCTHTGTLCRIDRLMWVLCENECIK